MLIKPLKFLMRVNNEITKDTVVSLIYIEYKAILLIFYHLVFNR